MSEILTAQLVNALQKKGFRKRNTHHEMWWHFHQGKPTPVHTWISHGPRKQDAGLIRLIASEMKLSQPEPGRFVECSMSEAEYGALLVAKGIIHSH